MMARRFIDVLSENVFILELRSDEFWNDLVKYLDYKNAFNN